MSANDNLESLVANAVGGAEVSELNAQALHLLLADYLACASATPSSGGMVDREGGGVDGTVAELVRKGSLLDLDDVHWPTLVHIGAVIWPVVLGVGAQVGADGQRLLSAADAAYSSTIALAMILGPGHAARFHVTATCGVLGAAVAAAMLYGLRENQLVMAGAHAVSTAGGLGQATIERSRTMVFHRIIAATTGCQAARFAKLGYEASMHVLDGDRGILAVLGGGSTAVGADRTAASSDVSVRIYPVNGFGQGPVELASRLGERFDHEADRLTIELPATVARAMTGNYGGHWWDAKSAVAAAFASGDPFELQLTQVAMELRDRVEVKVVELPVGSCRLTVHSGETITDELAAPPGADLSDEGTKRLLAAKWRHLANAGGPAANRMVSDAEEVLRPDNDAARELVRQLLARG